MHAWHAFIVNLRRLLLQQGLHTHMQQRTQQA
jgi:hypothetical protein